MRRTLLYIVCLLLVTTKGFGQLQVQNKDSLLRALSVAKADTNKVMLLLNVGSIYERNQPDSAIYFYKAAEALSKQLNYTVGILKFTSYYTAVLNVQDKYYESLQLNLQAVELAKKINNQSQLAIAYSNTGTSYYGLKDYTKCIDYFLKTSDILEQRQDKNRLVQLYANLCGLFQELSQYKKGYEYGLKAINLSRQLNEQYMLEEALINTSNILSSMRRLDTSLVLLHEAKQIASTLKDRVTELTICVDMADIFILQQRYDEMKKVADECLVIAKEVGNKEGQLNATMYIGRFYFCKKDYGKAKVYAEEALQLSKENEMPEVQQKARLLLSDISLGVGDLKGFFRNREISDSINDQIFSKQILKNTQDLEAKYSLDKKQSEINELNNEKKIHTLTLKQRRTTIIALCISLAVIGFAGLLFFRNTQQKRKLLQADATLKQQRIHELEKEKQLSATQSILQGQEEERKRLAKDLHDGLGGILSSTKYAFNNMKTNLVITPESATAFDRSMAMLDKSISELRRVSHNMMPEALLKFGLDTALKDYCNSINQSGVVQLSYQSFEMNDESVTANKASVIYRIVQELINNILKHANAKNALVQLIKNNTSLSITVEDDGTGFDSSVLQSSDGIGYLNLQNRVTYLSGTMDVKTEAGKGTSVNIEIPNINA